MGWAQSQDRVNKERAMRRRQLKGLWKRLKELQKMKLKRDELLKKLGASLLCAKTNCGRRANGKAATCYAATSPPGAARKNSGSFTSN